MMKSQKSYQHPIEYHQTMLFHNQKQNQIKLQHQHQQPGKDLIVSVDENYPIVYNIQPHSSSFENSSSRSLNETIALLKNQGSLNESKFHYLSNSNFDLSSKEIDCKNNNGNNDNETKIKIKPSRVTKSKPKSGNSNKTCTCFNNDTNKSKSFFSCYIIQLYFVYLIICAIIMGCSFGFYYTIASTNLRITSLERKLTERIMKRLPLRLIPNKEYFNKDSNDNHDESTSDINEYFSPGYYNEYNLLKA